MESFPAFFPLKGLKVVIAGDGDPAEAKARLLAGSPAYIVRLEGDSALDPAAYAGAGLIFVASWDPAYAAAAAAAARTAGAPLNVADHPELSDFLSPAIVDRGPIVAAIGASGTAPLMAALLRAEIELRIPPAAGPLARLLGDRREALRAAFPDLPARRAFLRAIISGPIAETAGRGDLAAAGRALDAAIEVGGTSLGQVSFIDVPAAADLLSVRAVRALNIADMLLADDGAEAILDLHGRRDAVRRPWSRQSEAAIAEEVRAGRLVAVMAQAFPEGTARRLAAMGIATAHLQAAPGP